MYKINVLIITYNQENVIRRSIDSILIQKEFGLNKIVVSDDCSKDKTWDILNEYKSQYPEIFILNRNNPNLGIYPNLAKLMSIRDEADFYIFLSGDDAYCDGFFKEIQFVATENNIKPEDEVVIYSNWKTRYPDGREVVFDSSRVTKGMCPFSLYIRGKVSRGCIISKSVIDKYRPLVLDKGLLVAEASNDVQKHYLAKRIIYTPVISNVYYAGIGVSTHLNKSDYYTKQALASIQFLLENYATTEKDKFFLKYQMAAAKCRMSFSLSQFFRMFYYFMRGYLRGSGTGMKPLLIKTYCIFKEMKQKRPND